MSLRIDKLAEKHLRGTLGSRSGMNARQLHRLLTRRGVFQPPPVPDNRWFEDQFWEENSRPLVGHTMSYWNGSERVTSPGLGWTYGPDAIAGDLPGPTIYVGEGNAIGAGDAFNLTPISDDYILEADFVYQGAPGNPLTDFELGFYLNCGTAPAQFVPGTNHDFIRATLCRTTVNGVEHAPRAYIAAGNGSTSIESWGTPGEEPLPISWSAHTLRAEVRQTQSGHYDGNLNWVLTPVCAVVLKLDNVQISALEINNYARPTNYVGIFSGENADAFITAVRCLKS